MGHSYAMAYYRNYIHMSLGWQAVSVTILPRWCPGARWCPVVPWCPGALVPSPALVPWCPRLPWHCPDSLRLVARVALLALGWCHNTPYCDSAVVSRCAMPLIIPTSWLSLAQR